MNAREDCEKTVEAGNLVDDEGKDDEFGASTKGQEIEKALSQEEEISLES